MLSWSYALILCSVVIVAALPATNSSVNSSPHHLLPRGKVVCPFQDGRENSFAIYHPQVKTIAHPITVTFQRFTAEGCVYTLKYPVRNPNTRRLENALAKTPRLDLQSKTFTEQERTALERTGALFFSGMNEGREWFLTKEYDGFRLIDHPVYQAMFPALYNEVNDGANVRGIKAFLDCEAFMEGEYVRLVNSLNAYVLDSSVVPAHLNWDFFLLSPTMDNRAPKYINTNWEHAQVWEPFASTYMERVSYLQSVSPRWLKILREESSMPILDNTNYQGICFSARRQTEGWVHPDVAVRRMQEQIDQLPPINS